MRALDETVAAVLENIEYCKTPHIKIMPGRALHKKSYYLDIKTWHRIKQTNKT